MNEYNRQGPFNILFLTNSHVIAYCMLFSIVPFGLLYFFDCFFLSPHEMYECCCQQTKENVLECFVIKKFFKLLRDQEFLFYFKKYTFLKYSFDKWFSFFNRICPFVKKIQTNSLKDRNCYKKFTFKPVWTQTGYHSHKKTRHFDVKITFSLKYANLSEVFIFV